MREKLFKLLLDKGFTKTIYTKQQEDNIWYSKSFDDAKIVKEIMSFVKEDISFFDFDEEKLEAWLEIKEDLTFAQYAIREQNNDYNEPMFGDIEIADFIELLEQLDDKEIIEG